MCAVHANDDVFCSPASSFLLNLETNQDQIYLEYCTSVKSIECNRISKLQAEKIRESNLEKNVFVITG